LLYLAPKDGTDGISEKMKSYHQQIVTELKWTKDQQKKYYDRRRVEAPSLKESVLEKKDKRSEKIQYQAATIIAKTRPPQIWSIFN